MLEDKRDWLVDALGSLSEFERHAVELVYFAHNSLSQAAAALNATVQAVCAAVTRAFRVISTACEAS